MLESCPRASCRRSRARGELNRWIVVNRPPSFVCAFDSPIASFLLGIVAWAEGEARIAEARAGDACVYREHHIEILGLSAGHSCSRPRLSSRSTCAAQGIVSGDHPRAVCSDCVIMTVWATPTRLIPPCSRWTRRRRSKPRPRHSPDPPAVRGPAPHRMLATTSRAALACDGELAAVPPAQKLYRPELSSG